MDVESDSVAISVRDDGDGFAEPSEQNGRMNGGGFGLFSIRERLSNIGGSCTASSSNGGGAQICLLAPRKEG